jgi:hypothetical protein
MKEEEIMVRRYVVQHKNGKWIANAYSETPLTIFPELARRYPSREKARLAVLEAESKHGGLFVHYREDAEGDI